MASIIAGLPALIFVNMLLNAETLAWQALWIGSLLIFKGRPWPRGALVGIAKLARDMLILLPFFGLALVRLRAIGLWLSRRTSQIAFAIPVAYVAVVYLPFHNVEARYSLLALPFLSWFAVDTFKRAWVEATLIMSRAKV